MGLKDKNKDKEEDIDFNYDELMEKINKIFDDEEEQEECDTLFQDEFINELKNHKNDDDISSEKVIEILKTHKKYEKLVEYNIPPLSLLSDNLKNDNEDTNNDCENNKEIIERVFKKHKIKVVVEECIKSVQFTRYILRVPPKVKLLKIKDCLPDLELETKSRLIMYTPLPKDDRVGVDIPNKKLNYLSFKEMVSSKEFLSTKNKDKFVLGKTIENENYFAFLKYLPHLLISGSTCSGKSIFLHSLMMSLVYSAGPEDLRILLIDPKAVEFNDYKDLPHLLTKEPISDFQEVLGALNYVVNEMNDRYMLLKKLACRNYDDYLKLPEIENGMVEKKPRLLVVIDELQDLMLGLNKKEVEKLIVIITQKARAVGIQLVVSTQRATSDVITGNIRANFNAKIAFKVSSYMESLVALEQCDAEKLLGNGDMLLSLDGNVKRLQGCYISSKEVKDIINYIKENNHYNFEKIEICKVATQKEEPKPNVDDMEKRAVRVGIENGFITISLIEKELQIGYMRASRLVDTLKNKGFISSAPSSLNHYEILMTKEDFKDRFGEDF